MSSLAERKCLQRGRPFAELFRKQYVISEDSVRRYPGLVRHEMAGWVLHVGEALRVQEIRDRQGAKVGFLLGHAMTPGGKVVEGGLVIDATQGMPGFSEALDAAMNGLAGRYLGVVLGMLLRRVYLDPVSDIPVLYDPAERRIASSLGLVLDRAPEWNPAFSPRKVLGGKQVLSLGHSLDRHVKRAISNHSLELGDFTLRRHWPGNDMVFDAEAKEVPELVEQICARLRQNIGGLLGAFECTLPMTGGRDSRILLAAALPEAEKVREFSCHRFHNPSRRDAKVAHDLLKTQGLQLKQYFKKPYTTDQIRDMRLKMGWSGWRGELGALASMEEYPRDHVILRGNIMEILRATQWRKDKAEAPFNMRHGVRRLQLDKSIGDGKAEKIWAGAYQQWLETLPEGARGRAYDFGWTELHLPNHQGAYFNGFHTIDLVNPFNDRALIALATRLPARERLGGKVVRKIIGHMHAPFLEVPFV